MAVCITEIFIFNDIFFVVVFFFNVNNCFFIKEFFVIVFVL